MSRCARCGAEFSCGVADDPTDAPCWCMQLPTLPAATLENFREVDRDGQADARTASCLCRACLLAALATAAP